MCQTHFEPVRHDFTGPLLLLLTLAGWLFAAPAWSLSSDREQPIEVEADGVEFDEAANRSVYRGNVILVQGSLRLQADRVTVEHRGRQPAKIIAEGGPVRFQQMPDDGEQLVKGRAKTAEYEIASEELVLIGEALLTQGNDSFSSDRIVYDRETARVKAGAAAQGSERVRITITPPGAE